MMASEQQETGVDAWFRAWATRDFAALAAMYHPEAEYRRPDGSSAGVAEIIAYLRALAAAAPEATATVEAAHFSSEAVTVEWIEQEPGGVPEPVVDVFRVRSGRIVSQRQYFDPARRLRKLAALASGSADRQERARPPEAELFGAQADPGATIVAGAPPPVAAAPAPPAPAEQPVGGGSPALRFESGPDRGLVFALTPGTLSIGRALDNGLVLRDPATSGHHAQIQSRDGELLVADLESTNGTFVNGEKIRQRQLAHGDRLAIGQNGLVVIVPVAAAFGG